MTTTQIESPPRTLATRPTENASPSPSVDVAIVNEVSATLSRRGYLTTEWWTTVLGTAMSALLALLGVQGSTAAQVVAISAPVALSAAYAVVRTMNKSRLAQLLAAALPQADQPV